MGVEPFWKNPHILRSIQDKPGLWLAQFRMEHRSIGLNFFFPALSGKIKGCLAGNLYTGYQNITDTSRISEVY